MTFIRIQNAKKDAEGNIIGGSASIVDSVYKSEGSVRCKQVMRESLGTIVFMDSRRSGIFMSKTRGLVHYDVDTDEFGHVSMDDPHIPDVPSTIHDNIRTFFGDCDIVLNVMRDMGITGILRNIAVDDDTFYSKMVCHTLHSVLRDGSRIRCDRFIERTFLSNVIGFDTGILRTDTRYFDSLGEYDVKVEFFKRFVQQMRQKEPGIRKGMLCGFHTVTEFHHRPPDQQDVFPWCRLRRDTDTSGVGIGHKDGVSSMVRRHPR